MDVYGGNLNNPYQKQVASAELTSKCCSLLAWVYTSFLVGRKGEDNTHKNSSKHPSQLPFLLFNHSLPLKCSFPRYHIKLFSETNAPYFTEMTLHRQFHGDVTSTHYKVICEKSSIFVSKKMVLHVLKHDQGYKKCNLQSNFTEKNLEPSKVAILRTNTPLRYRFKPVHWSSIGGANESLTIQFQAFFPPPKQLQQKKTCLSNSFSHSGFNLSCLCVASNHGREKN